MESPLRIALIIGVDQYKDELYTELKGAVRDASRVGAFLEKQLGFETICLTNPVAADVENALIKIRKTLDDDSVFIFYFAGHGASTDRYSDRQVLFCVDATEDSADGSSGGGVISPGVITKFVREGRGDMFFCFDVCRAPAFRATAQNRGFGNDGITTEGTRAVRDAVTSVARSGKGGRLANRWTLGSGEDKRLTSDEGQFVESLLDVMRAGLASGKGIELGDGFVRLVEANLKSFCPNTNQRPVANGRPFTLAPCTKVISDTGVNLTKTIVQKSASAVSNSLPSENVKHILEEQEVARRKFTPLEPAKTDGENESRVPSRVDFLSGSYAGERRELQINGVKFAFRYCPAGFFIMGSPSSEEDRDDDEIQREVTISDGFWIAEVPTTQEQWNAVGVKKENPCRFTGAKLPVELVTWFECDAFVKKLNERSEVLQGWRFALPSEEQWEYACRAGTTGSTYGVPLDECAWYRDNSGCGTHEVGLKKPNAWGVYDMLGNVYEWTSSKYDDDPVYDGDDDLFVQRGCSWYGGASGCRPAKRGHWISTLGLTSLGFRIALVRSASR